MLVPRSIGIYVGYLNNLFHYESSIATTMPDLANNDNC